MRKMSQKIKKLNVFLSSIIENDDGRGLRVYTYLQEDRRINRLKQDNDFYRWQFEKREEEKIRTDLCLSLTFREPFQRKMWKI